VREGKEETSRQMSRQHGDGMAGTNLDMYQGLRALYKECTRIYPDQENPLQVNSLQKFWLGGPDVLDYISMYINQGNPALSVPPHWHYVSFGLTDLHGDGRVYPIKTRDQADTKSGYGFELTFRIKRERNETDPPLWPANVMQALAKYIFKSGNNVLPGDHISWHQSLSGQNSKIVHMLLTTDPEFKPVHTPYGNVQFVQIIGITSDELEAVQHWNGGSFIDMMKRFSECGGEYLVTDMQRELSVFQIDLSLRREVAAGIDRDGSNLSGVTAECSWNNGAWKFYDDSNMHHLKPRYRTLNISMRKQQVSAAKLPKEFDSIPDPVDMMPDLKHEYEMLEELCPSPAAVALDPCDGIIEDNVLSPALSDGDAMFKGSDASDGLIEISNSADQLEEIFNDLKMSRGSDVSSDDGDKENDCNGRISYFDNIHIALNLEAGLLIPLALKGRVRHGRHFTFKSGSDDFCITFVTSSINGAYATSERPFASHGNWLHILLQDALIDAILLDFEAFMKCEGEAFPRTFLWPEYHFAITINA